MTPLTGTQARIAADVQGRTWHGIVADDDILQAVAVRRQLDERGDALLASLIAGLGRAAAVAKRERIYELHTLLVDFTAAAILIGELDDAEDTHDVLIRDAAEGSKTSLRSASRGIGQLLGQSEAEASDSIHDQAWPLDRALMFATCGRQREPMGAIRFEPCAERAGHEDDGGVHVFLAIEPGEGGHL